jgi:alkylation response protein AidB-like acyl-CoA dehydrogenase
MVGDHAVINGEKTWISNGGIADYYVVFARSGEAKARAVLLHVLAYNLKRVIAILGMTKTMKAMKLVGG